MKKLPTGSIKDALTRSAAGTFGLKVVVTGLAFISNVLLARLLGVTEYGIYAYVGAWVSLLNIASVLGLDILLVREVATYQTQSAWHLLHGLLGWADRMVLRVSLALAVTAAVIAAGIAWAMTAGGDSPEMPIAFWVAMMLLPLLGLMRLRQAALRGLHHILAGHIPESLIQPVLFIAMIGGAALLFNEGFNETSSEVFSGKLTAPWAVGMNVAATGAAFLVGTELLRRKLPRVIKDASPSYQTGAWVRSALPLLFIAGMNVINAQADILMLGAMKGAEAAGVYTVAKRGADLIAFTLIAVDAALAPTAASLWATGELKLLQRVVTKSARLILLISLPVAIGFIIFGAWFLVPFGPEFTKGRAALAILSVGQLMNAGMGSVGLLLIMTGHERDVAVGFGISALSNVILNAAMIPAWGLEGAAAATASSIIIWNVLLALRVYQRLGIYSTAFGRLNLRTRI